MAIKFNDTEELDDSVFPVNFDDNSNLDMYGVWIKKTPEKTNQYSSSEEIDKYSDVIDSSNKDVIEFSDKETQSNYAVNYDSTNQNETPNSLDDFDDIDFSMPATNNHETNFEETKEKKITDLSDDEYLGVMPEFKSINIEKQTTSNSIVSNIEEDERIEENKSTTDTDDFEILDLDDFLNDNNSNEKPVENQYSTPKNEINEEKIEQTPIENSSYTKSAEFDDLLNDLEKSSPLPEQVQTKDDNITMNITIDEESDISTLSGKSLEGQDGSDDVSIFDENYKPIKKEEPKMKNNEPPKDDLIIESTIIEAGNIEQIKEENKRILNETEEPLKSETDDNTSDNLDAMLDDLMGPTQISNSCIVVKEEKEEPFFDDIEAVKNDLYDDVAQNKIDKPIMEEKKETVDSTLPETSKDKLEQTEEKRASTQKDTSEDFVLQNDRATEILLQIAGELSSIKTELATLKDRIETTKKTSSQNSADVEQNTDSNNFAEQTPKKQNNGFFTDDDGDETIALTGDELNNILITADFTEENASDDLEDVSNDDDTKIETQEVKAPDIPSFIDEALTDEIEPKYINSLDCDISYIDKKDDIFLNKEESAEDYIDIPDVASTQNSDVDNLEVKNIDDDEEEFEIPTVLNIDTGNEVNNNSSIDIGIDDIMDNDPDDEFEIPEELIIDSDATTTEKTLSAEELDSTMNNIPRLEFDTSTAEAHKAELDIKEETPDSEEFDIPLEPPIDEEVALADENTVTEGFDTFADIEFVDESVTDNKVVGEPHHEEVIANSEEDFEIPIIPQMSDEALKPQNSLVEKFTTTDDTERSNEVIPENSSFEKEVEEQKIETSQTPTTEDRSLDSTEYQSKSIGLEEKAENILAKTKTGILPIQLKEEIKSVLSYMDQLLESLPEEKIEEFAKSEYFDTYKRLFEELGIS